MQCGRRGVDIEVSGEFAVAQNTAWDDSTLVIALLDEDGSLLGLERNSLRFEEASGPRLLFRESCRVAPSLAEGVASAEIWASASILESSDCGTFQLDPDLPAPRPGTQSFHTHAGSTLARLSPDETGETRLTAYGRCMFNGSSNYESRGEIRLSAFDSQGSVLYHEDGRFETLNGHQGPVVFDERFRLHIEQLQATYRIELSTLVRRLVSSERVAVTRQAFVQIDDS
jgi:hypothetical protein